ncbi:MAG: EAL domain-containing protein [Eubacteriales bacterium]
MKNKLFVTRLLTLLLTIVFLPLMLASTNAQASQSKTTIKIGYVMNFGTIQYPAVEGSTGYAYDHFDAMMEYLDDKYVIQYVACDYDDVFPMLDAGEIDFFGPISKSDYLEENYLFTENNFGYADVVLRALEDDPIYYGEYEKLDGATIGVEDDNHNILLLNALCKEYDVTPTIVSPSTHDNTENMQNGEYQYYLSSTLRSESNQKIIATLDSVEVFFLTTPDNAGILADLDDALSSVKDENYAFSYELYNQYYGKISYADPYISEEELALLQSNPIYEVGYSTDSAPLSYIDENGEAAGLSVDILNLVAQQAGVTFQYIPIELNNRSTSQDLDMNLASVHSSQDPYNCIISDSYLSLPLILIHPAGSTYTDITVGILDYYSISTTVMNNYYHFNELVSYNDYDSLYKALENGDIDAIILSNVTANVASQQIDLDDYIFKTLEVNANFQLHFNADFDEEAVTLFNRIIASLDENEIDLLLLQHAVIANTTPTFLDVLSYYSLQIIIGFLVVFATVIAVIAITISRKNKKFQILIDYDTLTGLISSKKFVEDAQKLLGDSEDSLYSLLLMDIDNFKYLNEAYGYEKGSQVLIKIAEALPLLFPTQCLTTRISGDRFAVLLPKHDLRNHKIFDGAAMQTYMTNTLESIIGKRYHVVMSIGIYHITDKTLDIDYMMDCAHLAKNRGKTSYNWTATVFSNEINSVRSFNNHIAARMEDALASGEFRMVYQPKINLTTGKMIGAEALVRWLPPNEPPLFPDQFIPVFERNGFVTILDYYIIRMVCSFVTSVIHTNMTFSINLSGHTLLDPDLIEHIVTIVDEYEIPHSILEFEITEHAIITNMDLAVLQIAGLQEQGFTISMDDFGSGVSSLNRLKDLNIDIVKIDKEFLNDSLNKSRGITIIENIIRMASELDIDTVAEGIESGHHVELLKKFNCTLAQGFYFSKPVWEQDFLTVLNKQ